MWHLLAARGTHPAFSFGKLMETDLLENPHRPTWQDNIEMGQQGTGLLRLHKVNLA